MTSRSLFFGAAMTAIGASVRNLKELLWTPVYFVALVVFGRARKRRLARDVAIGVGWIALEPRRPLATPYLAAIEIDGSSAPVPAALEIELVPATGGSVSLSRREVGPTAGLRVTFDAGRQYLGDRRFTHVRLRCPTAFVAKAVRWVAYRPVI
jgi:hypothetical protein